jgi:hypothetical protein
MPAYRICPTENASRIFGVSEGEYHADATAYFLSSQALRSDDPAVRRPAISTLIALAQHAVVPVSARASAVLTKEFGPFAVTEGLSGCAAPLSVVHPHRRLVCPRSDVAMRLARLRTSGDNFRGS